MKPPCYFGNSQVESLSTVTIGICLSNFSFQEKITHLIMIHNDCTTKKNAIDLIMQD